MSDLISRQDAIRIAEQGQIQGYPWQFEQLVKLPSAQPVIRCKDCKHRIVNEHYGEKGYMDLKAMCDLDTDDIFQLGRNAENDDWFCADGERKADG